MNRQRQRFDLRINRQTLMTLKNEHHRLEQLLIKLQNEAKRPASTEISKQEVAELALLVGLEALRSLSYEAFESQLRSHGLRE